MTTLSMFTQDTDVSALWSLDVLGIMDPVQKQTKAAHEKEVLDGFLETTKLNSAGRYEVVLPWKVNHPPLVDNRPSAEHRLKKTINTLKSLNLLDDYQQVFDDWMQEGYIEQVPVCEVPRVSYYLPHRPVVKEGSSTRIRSVFGASAHEKAGPSLNDCLETGPNFIELIPSLLMRFREKEVAVIEERDHLRFLWYRDADPEKVIVYRHQRVVFGVSNSPFILGATLNLHIDSALRDARAESEKSVLRKLKKSFYVDNCVISIDSHEEAGEFQRISSSVLESGGFDLRAWEYSGLKKTEPESSVLGLRWHREEDTLSLVNPLVQKGKPSIITKRTMLSLTQQLFDPLGMICPVVICPKILLQQVWAKGLDWDVRVDDEVRDAFVLWMDQLTWLKEVKIPRWLFKAEEEASRISLHAFVDASSLAYAAVIFARVESNNRVEVEFVSTKASISPKETIIPRLELLAATVGARLMHSVVSAVPDLHCELYYWTDSSTVLTWIQRNKQWATFVWNRIQEIRQLTDPEQWSHVPGVSNPADLASRGCTAK
ncbi:uncharacterized protein LOC107038159 [Diachasma alloeum]|uniref:uncharacterized protein LOC107038159 n=1 Tax=Diachasma alloeum TaxID=454923 RepID=UPI000738503A|nr:uncharacterized protein LOC107038159 [Diachasma alloeum]